jgi:O-acetyl-ADP-ribose deacetylase (regulator of RNase III)
MYNEIEGNLISMALEGNFDAISHGCNCYCNMGSGIAPQMAKAFGVDIYPLENISTRGDIKKLGQIDYKVFNRGYGKRELFPINSYTQYMPGKSGPGYSIPLDYDALTLCLRKINFEFRGLHIGLPKIGAGLAGGDWERIKTIIQTELKDCNVTVVIFKS